MSKRKTDWEIVRGLANFVLSLGEFENDTYEKGILQERGSDGVELHTNGKYVCCSIITGGRRTMEFDCYENFFEIPNLSDEIQNFSDIKYPDVRKMNRVYRAKLQPMVANTKKRLKQQRVDRIKNLKEELKDLED